MIDQIGTVQMRLDGASATWDVQCTRCTWGTATLLEWGHDGDLGVENYEFVEALSQTHSDQHS